MEVLGIDIGGSGIKGAIVNTKTGELTGERHRIPTPKPATPKNIADTIKEIVDHFNWKGKIGCCFPTPLAHGKCQNVSNLHKTWKDVQVDDLFKEKTGLEFTVINDADAAGAAEMSFGAGKGKGGLVIIITLGTGIGSGIFFNGALVQNTELGHLSYKGEPFEFYAADSARKRDDLSYKQWGKRLNKYFKHVNLILSPDLFIIGGGASKKLYKFVEYIDIETPIIPAENKNEAGIIGAALAAEIGIK